MKEKSIITSIIILVFAVFAAGFVNPQFFNEKIETFNEETPFSIDRRLKEKDFELGLDLQGGAYLLYQADLEDIPEEEVSSRMTALRDLIERRVDHFGIGEPLVQVRGDRLAVELPGVKDQDEAIQQIGETPFLEFKIQKSTEKLQEIEEKRMEVAEFLDKEVEEIAEEDLAEEEKESLEGEIEDWEVAFEAEFEEIGLTGRYLQGAQVNFNELSGEPMVSLRFDSEGADILSEVTEENVGRSIATYLDEEVIQVATIQEAIPGGEAQISGNLSTEEARELARDLEIGALPVPISLISQQSVGPELGMQSLDKSVKAGLIGFGAVVVFMVIYYKLLGFLASVSLLIYTALVLSAFKLLGVTLTLSGIAGFILSIGMAIDANILIFSRIREELDSGKTFQRSLEEGFRRAWPSIRDGNLTTILVAFILFSVSTSFVQGFATVLIIGILISLFTSMIVTRSFIQSFLGSKLSEIKKLWI
ncbi:MAG: protein translocase subunit SecD [Patescibacteria group bacterium]